MSGNLRDKAMNLIGKEKASDDMGDQEDIKSITGKFEKILFKFSAFTDKVEADKKEVEALKKDVEDQRLEVGKMLVGLEEETKKIPKAIRSAVEEALKPCVNKTSEELASAIRENFTMPAQRIERATKETSSAAIAMTIAKTRVGWKTVILNLFAYPLFAILLLSFFCDMSPFELWGAFRR
jgi:hypothetical protein